MRKWYNVISDGRPAAVSNYININTELRKRCVKMSVVLTERAAAEVKRIMEAQKYEDHVLRVGVTGGGCSGFSYALGFDKEYDEAKDAKYEYHGVPVVVDKKSALYLDGTTVDFYEGIDRRGFTFDNPNAVKSCGCGSSFQA
jgi:iron-sulfur cluster assembly protein